VLEFYKQNAAFFGLILLVFFGFIKSSEHVVIGTFLIQYPVALILLYLIWMAYSIKVVLFLLPNINKKENQFLNNFLILDNKIKILSIVSAAVNLLAPILFYAVFLIFLSISQDSYWPVFSILGFSFLLIFFMTYFLHFRLIGLPHEKKVFQLRVFKKFTIHPILFFPSHLLRNEIVLLLLTKIYGCLLVIGTAVLYRTDSFDLRLLTTGVLLAAIGNVAIMNKYVWFQYQPMAFSLNLPISELKVILKQISNISLILIPELIVLIRYYPLHLNIYDLPGLFLFSVGLNYFMYSWMILKQKELAEFMVVLFWLVVMNTFLILFSVHPMTLGSFLLAISGIIVYFRHDKYEHLE